jgi:hypothetical protein
MTGLQEAMQAVFERTARKASHGHIGRLQTTASDLLVKKPDTMSGPGLT